MTPFYTFIVLASLIISFLAVFTDKAYDEPRN
jgi:hypothetical protein